MGWLQLRDLTGKIVYTNKETTRLVSPAEYKDGHLVQHGFEEEMVIEHPFDDEAFKEAEKKLKEKK